DDHDFSVRAKVFDCAKDRKAVAAGHHILQKNDIESSMGEHLERLVAAFGDLHREICSGEHFEVALERGFVIVDD
ncbi:MAG: hypothetical protein NT123_20875, partial [Proteobacteria bacterium]|nr:hypothetical protein [Pseudomonadota bacterium]